MELNKFFLFSSKSCPYAHRCEIIIKLLDLSDCVNVVYCDPVFTYKDQWKIIGPNNPTNYAFLKELYEESGISGSFFSLPVLYDNEAKKIILHDSKDIIMFFDKHYNNSKLATPFNYDVFSLEFDEKISKGTYRAGHAKTPEDYKKQFDLVFEYLDYLDKYLENKQYIQQNQLSIMDIIAYCHLIRFDLVFYNLFSLNKQHLWQYDNICKYLKYLSSIDAFKSVTDLDEIKRGAYLTENNLPQNLGCTKVPLGCGGIEHYF